MREPGTVTAETRVLATLLVLVTVDLAPPSLPVDESRLSRDDKALVVDRILRDLTRAGEGLTSFAEIECFIEGPAAVEFRVGVPLLQRWLAAATTRVVDVGAIGAAAAIAPEDEREIGGFADPDPDPDFDAVFATSALSAGSLATSPNSTVRSTVPYSEMRGAGLACACEHQQYLHP